MRFRCPSCQRSYRLSSADRIQIGVTARLECPGCRATLLLSRAASNAMDLHVSAVASPPVIARFFGDSAAANHVVPPDLPWLPALPLVASEVQPVRVPDYDRLLQEFSVLFRLHTHKRRSRHVAVAAGMLAAVLALLGGVWIGMDGVTRGELLAWAEGSHPTSAAVAAALPVELPVTQVEPAVAQADPAPFPWPGLSDVDSAMRQIRPALIVAAIVPQPSKSADESVELKAALAVTVPPVHLRSRIVLPQPAIQAVARATPRRAAGLAPQLKRLTATGNALPAVVPDDDDELFDLMDPDLSPHRSAGPANPSLPAQ